MWNSKRLYEAEKGRFEHKAMRMTQKDLEQHAVGRIRQSNEHHSASLHAHAKPCNKPSLPPSAYKMGHKTRGISKS